MRHITFVVLLGFFLAGQFTLAEPPSRGQRCVTALKEVSAKSKENVKVLVRKILSIFRSKDSKSKFLTNANQTRSDSQMDQNEKTDRSPADLEPLREPKKSDQYSVRHLKMDQSKKDQEPRRTISAVTTARARWFDLKTYDQINTQTAMLEHHTPIPRARGEIETHLWMLDDSVMIPSGFILDSQDFTESVIPVAQLTGTQVGRKYNLRNAIDLELLPEQLEAFTYIDDPLTLSDLPDRIRSDVVLLLSQQKLEKLSDWEVAARVVRLIKEKYSYTKDSSDQSSLRGFIAKECVQCTSDTLIWMSILRSFFKIPCVAKSVAAAHEDTEHPGHWVRVLSEGQPDHMLGVAYDRLQKKWKEFDPQPPAGDEDGKQDPRFKKAKDPEEEISKNEKPEKKKEQSAREKTAGDDLRDRKNKDLQKTLLDTLWHTALTSASTPDEMQKALVEFNRFAEGSVSDFKIETSKKLSSQISSLEALEQLKTWEQLLEENPAGSKKTE
ncbi:MAG: hypothetical protein JWQ35_931, partial [Bacteriovoracaceae bacterium]|nr:hypothetical protein [Bacteriovoracaceae bacterium]